MYENYQTSKLLISIVNHGMARKLVNASKVAGAEGGTTLIGKGTGNPQIETVFGIPVEPQKEIIFTLTEADKLENIAQAIINKGKLYKAGQGISLVIDIKKVTGISHLKGSGKNSEKTLELVKMQNTDHIYYDLIITIVNKGDAEKVVESSKKAGAEGGTILFGRGTGIHEHAKLFGITIEPEKEIVLTLIDRRKSDEVLAAIIKETGLNKPGKGIAFVLEVESVVGLNHSLNQMVKDHLSKD